MTVTAAMLASCGEGGADPTPTGLGLGGSPSAPTPTPTPTPTPSPPVVVPTPTPTPAPVPPPTPTPTPVGEIKPNTDSTSIAASISYTIKSNGIETTGRATAPPGVSFTISYDPISGHYTTNDGVRTVTYTSSDLAIPDRDNPYAEYIYNDSSGINAIDIFKAPRDQYEIFPRYSAYGFWRLATPYPTGNTRRVDWFTYGTATPASALPTSGVVTYHWEGTGQLVKDASFVGTEQSGEIRVDYAAKSFTTTVVLFDRAGNFTVELARFQVSGTLVGGTFGGPATFLAASGSGTLKGQINGPNADEIGFVYSANTADASIIGSVVGVKKQ